MQGESQNTEYKESWRDEYLKWVCGFANAQGGRLLVGVRDNGEVCGVADAKRLMEDIPNKVRDLMGILVDVNLKEDQRKEYVEVVTEAYPYPVSYRGKYYRRSGATNQELKGAALDRFMLRLQGRTWDGVPVPYLQAEDLDNATLDLFRRYAKRSGRMEDIDLQEDNRSLLDKLRLYEGDYLRRAAVLLFHPDPERYVTGAFVKVGFFREKAELVYQDEIHGNLFQQVAKLMDLLCTKYMKAIISYDDIQRVETLPVPREALREALLNACINKDYADHTPIQIRVFDNALEIVNGGVLPDNWTVDTLLSSHRSQPYNPVIANAFFRAGEIEAWGRGIERIIEACRKDGFSMPEFRFDASGVWTVFKYKLRAHGNDWVDQQQPTRKPTRKPGQNQSGNKIEEQEVAIQELIKRNPHVRRKTIAEELNLHESSVKRRLASLQGKGLIKHVGPAKGGYWEIVPLVRS